MKHVGDRYVGSEENLAAKLSESTSVQQNLDETETWMSKLPGAERHAFQEWLKLATHQVARTRAIAKDAKNTRDRWKVRYAEASADATKAEALYNEAVMAGTYKRRTSTGPYPQFFSFDQSYEDHYKPKQQSRGQESMNTENGTGSKQQWRGQQQQQQHNNSSYGFPFGGKPVKKPVPDNVNQQQTFSDRVRAWHTQVSEAFADYAAIDAFPQPPSQTNCIKATCQASKADRALTACPCDIRAAFSGLDLAQLKSSRNSWHPDRFSRCDERRRDGYQKMAKEVFAVVQAMYDEQKARR